MRRLLAVCLFAAFPASAASFIGADAAQHAFAELRDMCHADGGAMWGADLCGPTLFVDRATRSVVADRADRDGTLKQSGAVWVGTLPATIGISNTAVDWEGERWTMIMWPLPSDAFARKTLLAHESFHRIQERAGFPSTGPANAHLDSLDGRYLMQLEWRALAAALSGSKRGLRDAILFRARRRELFPSAANEERQLEMHEGLAEYTGTALAEPRLASRMPLLVKKLAEAEKTPSFVRSFAYTSGPAWGALLEQYEPHWTRNIKSSDDLGERVRKAAKIELPPDLARTADGRANTYDGRTLLANERAREEKRQARLKDFRARFVDGPVLVLPLRKMSMQFNPDDVQPFEPAGTVYPEITVSDEWGRIVVKSGALISSDFSRITVPAKSDGYTLELKKGWTKAAGARAGDFVVDKR